MTYASSFSDTQRYGKRTRRSPARTDGAGDPTAAFRTAGRRRPHPERGRPRSYRAEEYRSPRRQRRGLAGTCLLACALVAGALYAAAQLGALASVVPPAAAQQPASTPKGEWRAGEVPRLYQKDPQWAHGSYAGDEFGASGCGPTCLSMAYIALTGRADVSPADAGALSERMGCASEDGTAWAFMIEGAANLGLSAQELPADELSVRRALAAGSPVICSVGPGDFTSTGHFIVLAGVDAQGRLSVRDPNSPERTAQAWGFETVLAQCRNLWAYTLA